MEVPATSRRRRQAKLTLGAGIGYRMAMRKYMQPKGAQAIFIRNGRR